MMNKKYFNIHSYKRFYMGGRVGDQSAPALKGPFLHDRSQTATG